MAFLPPTTANLEQVPQIENVNQYISGYTAEQEEHIRIAKLKLDRRDLIKEPITLEEFRTIIAPWYRINRTEEFRLHPEKIKKERVPREVKPKKLSKAAISKKLTAIIMKLGTGQTLTEEEELFYKEHTGG